MRSLALFFLATLFVADAPAQIESGLLARVVEVSADGKSTGTAFVVDQDHKAYFVTAKHVFKGSRFPARAQVLYRTADGWVPFPARIAYSKSFDLAVLSAPENVIPSDTQGIPVCSRTYDLNEMFLFLGFPLGLHIEAPGVKELKSSALPYLKHAMMSGFDPVDSTHNLLVLDGINNEGFSGGPVLAKADNPLHFCVAGVVVAYRYVEETVYDAKSIPTESRVRENTGLMYAVPASVIGETISQPKAQP